MVVSILFCPENRSPGQLFRRVDAPAHPKIFQREMLAAILRGMCGRAAAAARPHERTNDDDDNDDDDDDDDDDEKLSWGSP